MIYVIIFFFKYPKKNDIMLVGLPRKQFSLFTRVHICIHTNINIYDMYI